MALLSIPDNQTKHLQKLISLPSETAEKLAAALREASPKLTAADFAKQIAGKVEPLSEYDLRGIVEVLFGLYLTREAHHVPTEQLVNGVIEAAYEKDLGPPPDSEPAKAFAQRLSQYLEFADSLGVTSRAASIITQHKNPFVSARILTDIRPVFSAGETPTPTAAMIVHNLEIVTFTDQRMTTYFAALDSVDLRKLRQVVERAVRKEETLKSAIQEAKKLTYIEIPED